jgi:NAD(P)-dependent dehydrogenase (short-subunit alcohol dehydrogenase family)
MGGLKGRVALVTGGGRGLGFSICKTLSEAGCPVAVADIREELAESAAEAIRCNGQDCVALTADIGDERQAAGAVEQVWRRFGRLDILVNNAGIDLTVPVDEMPVAEWDRIVRVNLRGPFLMSKFAIAKMKPQGAGSIVNIASTAAKRAWANASAYHATKWGLLGFSHALHVEARRDNIKVIAVISGGMKTPFLLDRFPDLDTATLQDPRNVAETVKFVLSLPDETVIPEVMVFPMRETSWP